MASKTWPLLCLLAAGCVELAPGQIPGDPAMRQAARPLYPGLDPGSKTQETLRFQIAAYDSATAAAVAADSEALYQRIMTDTGLYSFRPENLYPIVVYRDAGEFHRKTGLPEWSAGAAVGNAIYTFEGRHLRSVLAHEMTHLIFFEYMGRGSPQTRWLNEGLAVYEEQEAAPGEAPPMFGGLSIPFDEMVRMTPISEEQRRVSSWYQQAAGVVRFLIERGGRVGFSQFLRGLRDGRDIDDAMHLAFPGQWDSLAALEASWRTGR